MMTPEQLRKKLSRTVLAMTIPFTLDDRVDVEDLKRRMDFYISEGIRTVFADGSTGETRGRSSSTSWSLSDAHRPMATCSTFRALFLAALLPAAAAAAVLEPVVIIAGQSNAAGRADATRLPPLTPTSSPVRLDYVCSFGTDRPGSGVPDRSAGWIPLGPSRAHAEGQMHFGPEIGLGAALSDSGPLWIIKHGRGSTSLADDWRPAATRGPRLNAALLDQVRVARSRIDVPHELAAFVWVQGEADSTRADWAAAYDRNLREFITAVRRDLAAPALPFVLVLTGEGSRNPRMAHAAVVRAAQRAVAAEVTGVWLVAAADLTLSDVVHYDAPAQLELGRRLAAAVRAAAPTLFP